MRRLFGDLFEVDVGADDDFFGLGGDSLAGESLLASIERDFGIALPLSILLELPTPRTLAAEVDARRKAARPAILFTATDAGSRTPLFCIHGSNGTAAFSRKIRNVLPDRPIYAIRPLGLLPDEVPLVSVPEMARSYVREIRAIRPSGPYHIFGQCMTASIAYEVAQQLSAAGETVETVTLGDPMRLKRRSGIRRLYYRLVGRRAISIARRFPRMTGKERMQKVVAPALLAAAKTYEPRSYAGSVLIVAASSNVDELLHPKRGYPALVPRLETVIVEGGHLDVFAGMDPAAPGRLARAMASFLARHD
jgi:thioesterase domain-containing protein/acyl carrier protein